MDFSKRFISDIQFTPIIPGHCPNCGGHDIVWIREAEASLCIECRWNNIKNVKTP